MSVDFDGLVSIILVKHQRAVDLSKIILENYCGVVRSEGLTYVYHQCDKIMEWVK